MKKCIDLAEELKGLHTLETIQKELGIKRNTTIKTVSLLRKEGLVETIGGGRKKRWYRINTVPFRKYGNSGLYDMLNKYSRIKLWKPYEHRIFGRKMSVEEAIVRAVVSGRIRTVLVSLYLFNHVKNWSRLYKYAKEYDVRRKIGALYDVSRTKLKVRRMDERIRSKLLKSKDKSKYIIKPFKSKDFLEIEKRWNVCVPLNKADLEVYDEW